MLPLLQLLSTGLIPNTTVKEGRPPSSFMQSYDDLSTYVRSLLGGGSEQPQGQPSQSNGALSQPTQQSFTPAPQAAPQPTRAPMVTPGGTQKRGGPQMVPKDQEGFESLITRIMAGGNPDELMAAQAPMALAPMQAAMQPNPTDQRLAARTQQTPMAPQAVPQQGLLSRIGFDNGNQALGAFGAALAAAGSPDPVKAALAIQQQRSEEAKNKAELAQKNRPKFTPLAGGALVMAEIPGMAPQIMPATDVQEWLLKVEGVKATNARDRQVDAVLAGEAAKGRETDRTNVTAAAGGATTKPEFNPEVRNNLARVDALIAAVPKADTLPGGFNNPMIANAIDQTFGRLAGTPDYETRRNVDTVFKEVTLSFVKKLGSNPSEGDRLFAERMQAAQDDPTSRKLALLQQYRDMTETAEKSRVEAATKRDAMAPTGRSQGATPAPAAAGVSSPTSKAAYDALPAGTQYVAPDGKTYTKR